MKKLFVVISGTGIFLSIGLSTIPAAHANSGCRNATIAGSFGVQATGTILEGAAVPPGLFASSGLINFDGNGKASTSQTISSNGTIVQFKASGTYEVEENCTLTTQLTYEDTGVQLTASGVIVKRGTEILLIETNPNTVITGT